MLVFVLHKRWFLNSQIINHINVKKTHKSERIRSQHTNPGPNQTHNTTWRTKQPWPWNKV